MTIFPWERAVQGWVERVSAPILTPLRVGNIVLADEGIVFAVWLPVTLLAGVLTGRHWRATVTALALLASPRVEEWLKDLFKRGRPRDPGEWGIPSGDCMLVAIWTPPLLGGWAALPIALVMWARMALGAHWVLDVLLGVALGLWLVSLALLDR